MKKLYLSLLVWLLLVSRLIAGTQFLTVVDTNDMRSFYSTGIIVTNQAVITGTNCISYLSVQGVTNTVGSADAGKIVKLNDSGQIGVDLFSNTRSSVISTNISRAVSGTSYTWTQIATLNTTSTTGAVCVVGNAASANTSLILYMRIRDSGSTVSANVINLGTAGGVTAYSRGGATLCDYLTGSAKTYVMEVSDNIGSGIYTNAAPALAQDPGYTNGLSLKIIQTP